MSDYNFTLPWPPSVNGYWKPLKNRIIISIRGRDYRKAVIDEMKNNGLFDEMLTGDLSVSITLNPPTLRRYDVDNFNKAVFDALTHSNFWHDDEQVTRLTVEKGCKIKDGNVELSVKNLADL